MNIEKCLGNMMELYQKINDKNGLRFIEKQNEKIAYDKEVKLYNEIVLLEKDLNEQKRQLFNLLGEKQ